jgi:protein phosphatase
MQNNLQISYGCYSTQGIKEINQDFCDIALPKEPFLTTKGIALCMADGISSSDVSQEASKVCVQSFLEDYYCTSEAWSVKNAATKVISATNSWLFAKNKENKYHYEKDSGFVCTFSSLILKSTTAHIFNIGDTRIYRLRGNELTQLTTDHRTWISKDKSYLARAMGIDSVINTDYDALTLEKDDIFLLMTDGVYECIQEQYLIDTLRSCEENYNDIAKEIITTALENNSDDNLTLQIVKINNLPKKDVNEIQNEIFEKPIPELLNEGDIFDGFEVLSILHSNSRSHVYLVKDIKSKEKVVLKAPSHDRKEDISYLESFLLEDWIAKRINNKHVLKAHEIDRPKNYLYILTEYIEGETLTQWIRDNPMPKLQEIRPIVEQIAHGLQAFHTLEMVHQDLRPENILINKDNQIKIIDFGSTKVEGIIEIDSFKEQHHLQGTALYSAPEYFIGEEGSVKSDIFSLAVIIYQMISNAFPYGTNVAKSTTKSAQNKLKYIPLVHKEIKVPQWFEEALKKALSINPINRYGLLSEFIYDLEKPNKHLTYKHTPALMEKDPVLFWQIIAFLLGLSHFIVYFVRNGIF